MPSNQTMRRTLATVLTVLALMVAGASSARASCAPPPPMPAAIDDAAEVFVGTVQDTTNSDRWATVEVSEVWKGDVAALVEVQAGPKDPPGPMGVASSVDRTFDEGKTYLFVPHGGSGTEFKDSSCSRTTVYREALDRFRPPSPSHPADEATSSDDGSSSAPWWIAGALAAALAAVAAFAARRRAASAP